MSRDRCAAATSSTDRLLDANAAENLVAYVTEQREATGTLPTDRAITVERFRDELGDWRICVLTPFGARVHAPWAMALQRTLSGRNGFEIQVMYTDDGMVLRFADTEELPGSGRALPRRRRGAGAGHRAAPRHRPLREPLPRERGTVAPPAAAQCRERGTRSGHSGSSPQNLLATVRRYPNFPVLLETYRQCLADVFDMPSLQDLLRDIRSRRVRVNEVETQKLHRRLPALSSSPTWRRTSTSRTRPSRSARRRRSPSTAICSTSCSVKQPCAISSTRPCSPSSRTELQCLAEDRIGARRRRSPRPAAPTRLSRRAREVEVRSDRAGRGVARRPRATTPRRDGERRW